MNEIINTTREKIHIYISLFLFILINSLFCYKYPSRISEPVGVLSVITYVCFVVAIYYMHSKEKLSAIAKYATLSMIVFTVLSLYILNVIPQESVKVDRWEIITLFWENVSNGIYPYAVQTPAGNYPGCMPVYFAIAYPFFLIGEIAVVTLATLWISFLYFKEQLTKNDFSTVMLLMFVTPVIYWETYSRSTILMNTLLFFLIFLQLKEIPGCKRRCFYLYAILAGLIISTRNNFLIPIIIWSIYAYTNRLIGFTNLVKWLGVMFATFASTFLPFIIAYPSQFMEYNPFITQGTALLPFSWICCIVSIVLLFSIKCKRFGDVVFLAGITFFLLATGHFIYFTMRYGNDAVLNGKVDISYYIFCIPFFIYNILNISKAGYKKHNDIKLNSF